MGEFWGFGGVQPLGFFSTWGQKGRNKDIFARSEAGRLMRPQGHRPWLKVAAIRDVRAKPLKNSCRQSPLHPITLQKSILSSLAWPSQRESTPNCSRFRNSPGFCGAGEEMLQQPDTEHPTAPREIVGSLLDRWLSLQANLGPPGPCSLPGLAKPKDADFSPKIA